jgi:Cysteine rich repeat
MRIRKLAVASAAAITAQSLTSVALAQMQQVMRYCKADAERLCPAIEPGGGRIAKCLKSHEMEISIGCGKALQKTKAEMGK